MNRIFFIALVSLLVPNYAFAQFTGPKGGQDLEEEFLNSLPSDIQGVLVDSNPSEENEVEIENLLAAETSIEKTKLLLSKITDQLNRIKDEIDKKDPSFLPSDDQLDYFGANFFRTTQSSFAPINIPNMDGSYIVDVGDVFTVTVVGTEEASSDFSSGVGRDGFLLLGQYGRFQVAGLTLSEVESKLKDFIKAKAITTDLFIQLDSIRDIDVMILGHVENPGIYKLSGGSNILTAVNTAGGISTKGSFRNIRVTRAGTTLSVIDLYDLFVNGDTKVLQTKLRAGDVIFVEPASFHVPVSGGANVDAIFEINEGESIKDLLSFAGGFSQDYFGFNYLTIYRSGLLGSRYIEITQNEFEDFKLQPRDSVIVPSFSSDLRQVKHVQISGRVKKPGTYFINDGDTLSDLIERAGGYEDDAYLYGAALFRSENIDKEKSFSQISYQDTLNYVISSIGRPEVYVDDQVLPVLNEELRSKAFEGRVVTNFDLEELRRNPAIDVMLQHKDRIIIPPIQKVVYMFGEFNKPTSIIFNPELDTSDYVIAAGGIKETAEQQLLVINPDGSTAVYKKNLLNLNSPDIYPGTVIYAPKDFGKLDGIQFSATLAPIVSSLAISLASLNSISD